MTNRCPSIRTLSRSHLDKLRVMLVEPAQALGSMASPNVNRFLDVGSQSTPTDFEMQRLFHPTMMRVERLSLRRLSPRLMIAETSKGSVKSGRTSTTAPSLYRIRPSSLASLKNRNWNKDPTRLWFSAIHGTRHESFRLFRSFRLYRGLL